MDLKLVVVRPFGPHARGDVVGDPSQIAQILGSEHAGSVVRVSVSSAPAAAAGAASTIGSQPPANAGSASGQQTSAANAASASGSKEG